MIKRMLVLVMAVVIAFAPVGAAHAQAAQESGYPQVIRAENPYAQGLQEAKKAYDDALAAYRAAAPQAYWSWSHYQTYVRAYYAVWNAYSRYTWYVQAYWYAERSQSFSGRVIITGSRFPARGATVQLMTYVPPYSRMAVRLLGTKTCDSDGRFRFDGIATGKYTYTVELSGYTGVRKDVEIGAGNNFHNIELQRQSPISGVVTARPLFGAMPVNPPPGWNDPRPLAGVKVSLFRTDVVYIRAPDANAIVTTGADGRFSFPSAEFSRARVVFEAPNYSTTTKDVTLGAGPVDASVLMQWNGPVPPAAGREAGFDDLNRR